jgi:hypothetical protein
MPIIASARGCAAPRAAAFGIVDGDPHQFRTGARQFADLLHGAEAMSAVSVLVIDCTTTGASPPGAAPA